MCNDGTKIDPVTGALIFVGGSLLVLHIGHTMFSAVSQQGPDVDYNKIDGDRYGKMGAFLYGISWPISMFFRVSHPANRR